MRKIILITLLLFPSISNAQKFTLDGFWGVSFKDSRESCKKTILSKYGYKPNENKPSPGTLIYNNIKFGANKCEGALLGFLNDQLFIGKIILSPDTDQKLLQLYNQVLYDISMKYHQPNENINKYIYPYDNTMSDGEKLIAIKGGYSEIRSKWRFDAGQSLENSFIELELNKDGYLVLTYAYGPLYDIFENAQKKDNSSVY